MLHYVTHKIPGMVTALVDVYEHVSETDGKRYKCFQIVMERFEGSDLLSAIMSRAHLTERDAQIIFRRIVDIVYSLHKLGIAHRDLKPENIMYKDNGSGKVPDIILADFGHAKRDDPRSPLVSYRGGSGRRFNPVRGGPAF